MKRRQFNWYQPWHPWVFLIPTLIGLFLFRLGPMVASFVISFTEWDILTEPEWIGITNYIELFEDPDFLYILSNTFVFSLVYVVGVMFFGLLLAVLVNSKIKGITFFRSAYFVPVVTSSVAVGLVWNWLLSPNYGLINAILERVFNVTPPSWLGDKNIVLIVVAMVQVWKMAGYYMILFLAGLQEIPSMYYEAARIDGASKLQSFKKITLPLLTPTTFFVFTIAIINSFKSFEIIYTMTQGGPSNATNTLVYSIYLNGFLFYKTGYASAMAYVLLTIVAIITYINFILKKRWVKYQY
ncbi:MAG: sugar ABC transporter permease [Thermotogota bacterium]|nr:sugar ABC transporter permease [Thermotogota bacterium]